MRLTVGFVQEMAKASGMNEAKLVVESENHRVLYRYASHGLSFIVSFVTKQLTRSLNYLTFSMLFYSILQYRIVSFHFHVL